MERQETCRCRQGRPSRWTRSWHATLFAASILNSCFLWTQAQDTVPIKVEPPKPVEGQSVTLTPTNINLPDYSNCKWYRGTAEDTNIIYIYFFYPKPTLTHGPSFTDRDSGGSDCSLHIKNLMTNDSMIYTLAIEGPPGNTKGTVNLKVSEILSNPVLWPQHTTVVENTEFVLHCDTSNSSDVTISWFKDGVPVSVPSDQSRNLTFTAITRDHGGTYQCQATNPISETKSNPSKITVAYGPNDAHLDSKGNITQQLGSRLDLRCIVESVPEAHFQWFFNNTDLNVMESTFSTNLASWEDEGTYTCQASNNFTKLNASASIYVKLQEYVPDNSLSTGAIVGIVIGVLVGIALIGGLGYFLCTKTALGRTEQHASNGNIPSAPGRNQGVTDSKPKSGEEDIQYSTLAFKDKSPPQLGPGPTRPLDSNTIYSEIKKK